MQTFNLIMQTEALPLLPAWEGAVYHNHQIFGIGWMLEAEEGYTIPETEHVAGPSPATAAPTSV